MYTCNGKLERSFTHAGMLAHRLRWLYWEGQPSYWWSVVGGPIVLVMRG